jgi:hypothetical protein
MPKSKIKMKMGTNVRKDVTQREQHGRTMTKINHGKTQNRRPGYQMTHAMWTLSNKDGEDEGQKNVK